MASIPQCEQPRSSSPLLVAAVWGGLAAALAVPVICESLARETGTSQQGGTRLVILTLAVTLATGVVLAATWRRVVANIGNAGLATISVVAGLQFAVSYASRLVGYVLGAALGPMYIFVDGIGSKGLSCLFLGLLVALIPKPGVMALALATLFVLNLFTSGQAGLVAIIFVTVSLGLHELLGAALGVTTGRKPTPAAGWTDGSFVLRVGLTIGLANGLALYAQYALYELLLRLYFDEWYKLSVSLVTGFLFGGSGAACGAVLGLRLRRTAP